MAMLRSGHARLVERFIFNFRLKPEALAAHLPASYLRPQVFHGWSVASFCMLQLERVMLSPLPSFPNMKTLSCAYRYGVLDTSGKEPVPSVYIPQRYTDLPIISRLGSWIFSSSIPQIRASITQKGDVRAIHINTLDRQRLFAAEIKSVANSEKLDSHVFDSLDAFAQFMHSGVSSYTPALHGDALARVDLHKDAACYEALAATVEYSLLDDVFSDAGLVFDSVIRTTGLQYKWTYGGLAEKGDNDSCL